MNTTERRREILKILQNADSPVAARALASRFGVSRQVIVQDLAVIRASTPEILSTTKGYVMQQDCSCTREFKVRHSQEKAADELTEQYNFYIGTVIAHKLDNLDIMNEAYQYML